MNRRILGTALERRFSLEEEDCDIEETKFKRMKKMSKIDEKKYPRMVVDSTWCQMYYIAACKKCVGCDFAVDGCENVVEMAAG